jgi:hypothetical protein
MNHGLQHAIKQRWTPRQLPSLRIWTEADAIFGLADGAAVASAPDLSGRGNHWAQAVGANQPVWILNGLNGLPVVRFAHIDAGDGHWLISPYSAANESVSEQTFAAVFRTNNPNDGEMMLWQGNSNGNGYGTEDEISLALGDAGGGNVISASYGGASQSPTAEFSPFNDGVNFHVAIGTFDQLTSDGATKTARVFVDGVVATPATGTTTNNYANYEANTFWGKPDAGGGINRVWNGDMAACVICAAVLTDADMFRLYNYWKRKYAL